MFEVRTKERIDEAKERKVALLDDTVSLARLSNIVLGYLVYTSKPSELFGKKAYLKKVKGGEVVKSVHAEVCDLSVADTGIHLPYSHAGYGMYYLRKFQYYVMELQRKSAEVRLVKKGDKHYIHVSLGEEFADSFPPTSLRGWLYVASLVDDEDIRSAVSATIPYKSLFKKIEERARGALGSERYLGSSFTVKRGDIRLTSVYAKDLYFGLNKIAEKAEEADNEIVELVALQVGSVKLFNPSREALALIDVKIRDVAGLREELAKLAIGAANYIALKSVES